MPISTLPLQAACWTTRNFHRLPGRWRLVRWVQEHAVDFSDLPPRTIRFAGDLRLRVDPRDENGRFVYLHGFDPRERISRQFVRLLRPGDHVVDVGANIGYFTFAAAHLVGPDGRVTAFEASPYMLPALRANAALNGSAPVEIHGVAVSDEHGEAEFHAAPPTHTGLSSLRKIADASGTYRVPTLPLDALLDRLPPVRLVKLDVEGAEVRVLRGMRRLVERDRPFIVSEMNDQYLRELGASAAELFALLQEAGYTLQRIGPRGMLTPTAEPPLENCNLLAVPPTESAGARA
ncbi:MAG: FkbM family methyltransferase [Phycisphaerales bacterium]|nr:FkbM family methyltransferase [Phycisphaerales bacterium]